MSQVNYRQVLLISMKKDDKLTSSAINLNDQIDFRRCIGFLGGLHRLNKLITPLNQISLSYTLYIMSSALEEQQTAQYLPLIVDVAERGTKRAA